MRKGILCMAVLVIMMAVMAGTKTLQAAPTGAAVEPIAIGAPIARASGYGQDAERAMTLAVEQINAGGGIKLSGQMRPIKLEIVDTRDQEPGVPTTDVLLAIEKLILEKKVSIIVGGPAMSECCNAALDLVAKYKILQIISHGCGSTAWSDKTSSDIARYKYSFRISGDTRVMNEGLIEVLGDIKEKKRFNKMYMSLAEATLARNAGAIVEKVAVQQGWTIVGRDIHPMGTTDYSMILRNVKSSGAQAIMIWDPMPQIVTMIKQWADMEIAAIPMGFTGPVTDDPGCWQQTDGKVAGLICLGGTAGNVPGLEVTPLTKPFFNAYKQKWGKEPKGNAAACYNALYLAKSAIERAGTLDSDRLVDAMEKTDLVTVAGRLRFNIKSHDAVYGNDPNRTLITECFQWQEGTRVAIWPPKVAIGEIKLPLWMSK